MSTFKNMASFVTFLIHHFINLTLVDDNLNFEILPEICPFIDFDHTFLGVNVSVSLIHTDGNMFRLIISSMDEEFQESEVNVILLDFLLEDILLKKYFKLGCLNIGFDLITEIIKENEPKTRKKLANKLKRYKDTRWD